MKYPVVTQDSIDAARRAQQAERAAVEMACGLRITDDGRIHFNERGASTVNADPDQTPKGASSHEQQS